MEILKRLYSEEVVKIQEYGEKRLVLEIEGINKFFKNKVEKRGSAVILVKKRDDERIEEIEIGRDPFESINIQLASYFSVDFENAAQKEYLVVGRTEAANMNYFGKLLERLKEYSNMRGSHILMSEIIFIKGYPGVIHKAICNNEDVYEMLRESSFEKNEEILELGKADVKNYTATMTYKKIPAWEYTPEK